MQRDPRVSRLSWEEPLIDCGVSCPPRETCWLCSLYLDVVDSGSKGLEFAPMAYTLTLVLCYARMLASISLILQLDRTQTVRVRSELVFQRACIRQFVWNLVRSSLSHSEPVLAPNLEDVSFGHSVSIDRTSTTR